MATTEIGIWAPVQDTVIGVTHMRWTGPGSLASTWKTPELTIGGGRMSAFLHIYGSGTAVNGASPGTFDAWLHPPDINSAAGSSSDTLPRDAVYFQGSNNALSQLNDPGAYLDGSGAWTNGWYLGVNTAATGPSFIMGAPLLFLYTANDTTGGQIDYLDLWLERA